MVVKKSKILSNNSLKIEITIIIQKMQLRRSQSATRFAQRPRLQGSVVEDITRQSQTEEQMAHRQLRQEERRSARPWRITGSLTKGTHVDQYHEPSKRGSTKIDNETQVSFKVYSRTMNLHLPPNTLEALSMANYNSSHHIPSNSKGSSYAQH